MAFVLIDEITFEKYEALIEYLQSHNIMREYEAYTFELSLYETLDD